MQEITKNDKVAAQIKALRLAKGMLQKEIAQLSGLSEYAYSRIENGQTQISVNVLFQIAEKLKIDVGEILELSKKSLTNNSANFVFNQHNEGTLNISMSPKEFIDLYAIMQEKKDSE